MLDLFPLLLVSFGLIFVLKANRRHPLIQLYLVIVFCYLNLFPAISQKLSFTPSGSFILSQSLVAIFFEFPLFALLAVQRGNPVPQKIGVGDFSVNALNRPSLLVLCLLLAVFWIVAITYDQFFVRLGYDAFLDNPESVPRILLYPYRITVEGSYFVILYLIFSLKLASKRDPFRLKYAVVLWLYLVTFGMFFLINSRMQFLLLLFCIYFVRPDYARPRIRLTKLLAFSSGVVLLIISLTLIREYLIESNDRLDAEDFNHLIYIIVSMIADRLNSIVMLTRALEANYNPFGLEISGLVHLLHLYFSFFVDPITYSEIRASEITSPSVEVINRLLGESHVDFPKSMVLDIQLTFGSLALPFLAWILAVLIKSSQRAIHCSKSMTPQLLMALFLVPLVLQFEKEFFGFISFALKWSPLLIFLLFFHRRSMLLNLMKKPIRSQSMLQSKSSI